jgi:hypothetical protein
MATVLILGFTETIGMRILFLAVQKLGLGKKLQIYFKPFELN